MRVARPLAAACPFLKVIIVPEQTAEVA